MDLKIDILDLPDKSIKAEHLADDTFLKYFVFLTQDLYDDLDVHAPNKVYLIYEDANAPKLKTLDNYNLAYNETVGKFSYTYSGLPQILTASSEGATVEMEDNIITFRLANINTGPIKIYTVHVTGDRISQDFTVTHQAYQAPQSSTPSTSLIKDSILTTSSITASLGTFNNGILTI